MPAVILSIVLNVLVVVIFRIFDRYEIQTLPAIVINYFVCAVLGFTIAGTWPWLVFSIQPIWLPFTFVLGSIFIVAFVTIAYTVYYYGVSYTSVFQKISLAIPAVYAIYFFGEPTSVLKWVGIGLAVASIYLINKKNIDQQTSKSSSFGWIVFLLPVITFLFNGVIDCIFFFVQQRQYIQGENFEFIASIFLIAAILGLVYFMTQMVFRRKRIRGKDVLAGLLLGLPNFFAVYFFFRSLNVGWGASVVVPINNVGIILLSTGIGIYYFSERFSSVNKVGMLLALAAIILISI